jgi:hypothetical protein
VDVKCVREERQERCGVRTLAVSKPAVAKAVAPRWKISAHTVLSVGQLAKDAGSAT